VAFHEKHPSISFGFPELTDLFAKHCILAGSRWAHTVCVFVIHQNITLMVQGAHLTAYFNAKNLLEEMVC
jgi:hypothetical protein